MFQIVPYGFKWLCRRFIPPGILFAFFLILSCQLISHDKRSGDKSHIYNEVNHSCTSFCLDNRGYALFCSNYDNQIQEGILFVNKRHVVKSGLDESTTGKRAHWDSNYGSVTFSLIGNQHVWAGMNETGLVISTMALRETKVEQPDERPPLSSGYWLQYILDQCSTIEEVIETISEIRMGETVDHYLTSDRYGNVAVLEWLDGRIICHTGNSVPVKCLTNNPYAELVEGWRNNEKPEFRKNKDYKSSEYRFRIAADQLLKFKSENRKSAIRYAFKTLDKVAGSFTQWSIVFDTELMQIHFHTKTNPAIRSVNLPDLDFSCKSPVLLLDIHENLSGDITENLNVYSSEYYIDYLDKAMKRWGADMSPEMIRNLSEFFESYPCKEE